MTSRFNLLHNNSNLIKYAMGFDNQLNIVSNEVLNETENRNQSSLPPIRKNRKETFGVESEFNSNYENQNKNENNINSINVNKTEKENIVNGQETIKSKNQNSYDILNNSTSKKSTSVFKNLENESKIQLLEKKLTQMENIQVELYSRMKQIEMNNEKISYEKTIKIESDVNEKITKLSSQYKDRIDINKGELTSKIEILEEFIRNDEKVKHEQRQRDNEIYKLMISHLTEKVSETVRLEIEERYKADLENKKISQNISILMNKEIENIKKMVIEVIANQNIKEKNISSDCSNRSKAIMMYIDSKVNSQVYDNNKDKSYLKEYILNLTEELKKSIQIGMSLNENLKVRVETIERNEKETLKLINEKLIQLEDRFNNKLIEYKNESEKRQFFEYEKIRKSNENVYSNMKKNISEIIENEKKINKKIINKIEYLENIQKEQFISITTDLNQVIIKKINEISVETHKNRIEKRETNKKLNEIIIDLQSKLEIKEVNERIIRQLENNELHKKVDFLRNDVVEINLNLNNDLIELNRLLNSNYLNLNEKSKLAFDQINKLASNTMSMFDSIENSIDVNMKIVKDNHDQLQISNLMSDMLSHLEKIDYDRSILNLHSYDDYLNTRVNDLQHLLITNSNSIKNEFDIRDIEDIVNKMMDEFDKVDNFNNLNKQVEEIYNTIEKVEDNAGEYIKSINEDIVDIRKTMKKNNNHIEEILRRKKDLENDEELKAIAHEIEERRLNDRRREMLIEENKKFREMLEVRTMTEEILVRLEFKNVYKNFEQIDKKLVKYDDETSTLKTKIRTNENKSNKIEKRLNETIYQYEEDIIKILMNDMLLKIELEGIHNEVYEGIKLCLDEERNLDRFNISFEKKTEKLKNELQILSSQYENGFDKQYKDVLEQVESKIGHSLEKIKQDNINMWIQSVQLQQKIYDNEEIRKIIQTVPAVVYDKDYSLKRIFELEHADSSKPKPILNKLKGNVDDFANEISGKGEIYKNDNWKKRKDGNNKEDNIKIGKNNEVEKEEGFEKKNAPNKKN